MYLLFEIGLFLLTTATLLLQIFLMFCVLFKSPNKMHAFRFALCLFLSLDFAFTFTLGFVLDPDMLVPLAKGAFVNGLAKLLGPNGGRIGFSIAIFFGAAMIEAQIYGLMFRYTAIQSRWTHLHGKFNLWKTRTAFLMLGFFIASICAIVAYTTLAAPEEFDQVLANRHHYEQMTALLAANPNEVLLLFNIDTPRGKILPALVVGGFALAQFLSFIFSLLIYRTLRENASRFSARTYQLHRQLTMLLIFQFCLPLLFVMLPVGYTIFALIYTLEIDKTAGDIGLLLLTAYTFSNSLLTLLFIGPYRQFVAKKIGVQFFRRIFKNQVNTEAADPTPAESN